MVSCERGVHTRLEELPSELLVVIKYSPLGFVMGDYILSDVEV